MSYILFVISRDSNLALLCIRSFAALAIASLGHAAPWLRETRLAKLLAYCRQASHRSVVALLRPWLSETMLPVVAARRV
jgi:hypothetical protein